jgi:hypothetical protein
MQLGSRWTVGSEPPARLSKEMLDAIAAVEAQLGDAASGERWTLTWLEGYPVAELPSAPELVEGPTPEVTIVRESHDGTVSTYTE